MRACVRACVRACMCALSAAENEKLVKTALDRVMRGRTTIVVAHRLSTIRDADKICVMENGRIVEQGQYASLIDKNGAFKKLVQRQQMDTQASVNTSSSRYLARKLSVDEELQAGSSPVLDDATVDEPITATTKGPAKGDEGKKSDSSDDKVEDEPKLGFKQMYERSGSAGPLLYVGCFCSLIMGGQFPAFNYIIAELIKVLTYCFEVSWCVPEVDAATRAEAVQWLQRDLPQEMSALSAATNGSYCPRLTSFGFESPFYLDEEACFDELNDRSRILCLLFLGMAGVVFVAGYVLYKSFGVLSEKIKGTLRTELMETLLTLDMEFYDDDANSAGAMSSRMASDAPIVASGYGISFGAIIQALVTVVLSLIFGFFYNWQLTLVMLAVLPINAVGMSAAMGAVGFVAAAQEKAAAATAIATEAIAGYRTVATFQIQNNVVALFEEEISASAAKSIKQVWITSCMYGILGMGSQIGTNALAFGYGGYLVREGLYTADDIMKVFLVVQGMGAGLAMVRQAFPTFAVHFD
jgi:ATP-binding cassette subfamily B (MDR/TAP) protein 1